MITFLAILIVAAGCFAAGWYLRDHSLADIRHGLEADLDSAKQDAERARKELADSKARIIAPK